MKRHKLPEKGIVTRLGAYKQCTDCLEKVYSEREWSEGACPGPILKEGVKWSDLDLGKTLKQNEK